VPPENLAHLAVVLIMGVAGSGKTTIGSLLAARLHWRFEDGDSFHSGASIAKMGAGIPLTDRDREPWLRAIAACIDDIRKSGGHAVVACSALKRRYRDVLIGNRTDVRLVYLKGSEPLVAARMAARHGHFMPETLLRSQFSALEEPDADENPVVLSVQAPPDEIVAQILCSLGGRNV